jgi:ketosteroid isomerase-like protein
MRSVLVLALLVRVASADPAADATKAFQGFVDRAGTDEPGLELFIPPDDQGPDPDSFRWAPLPNDDKAVAAYLAKPAFVAQKVVVSPSGSSAWIAGTIKNAKPRAALRASGMLVKDAKGWHVRAAHWSLPKPDNAVDPDCGAVDFEWHLQPGVPKELEGEVETVVKAFDPTGEDTSNAVTVMSDDKNALVFGSASKEVFSGGAAIKKKLKHWPISGPGTYPPPIAARAGISPDGQLMWMSFEIMSGKLCTMYRPLFILAKEKAGWRIVHQHYSKPVSLP